MIMVWISAAFLATAVVVWAVARRKFDSARKMEADAQATYLDARDLHAEARERLSKAYEIGTRLEATVGGARIVH